MPVIDKKALTQDVLMIAAFVAAVDGCALYTLKRAIRRPATRLFWALIILCVPVVGALIFFFMRPKDPIKPLAEESPISEVEGTSPASSCASGEATTPQILKRIALEPIKTPEGTSPSNNYLYAPSS